MEKDLLPQKIIHNLEIKKSRFWEREREIRSLELFQKAARDIPAYKDFLKKNKVVPQKIKTFKDFQNVPLTDKKNYLRSYPIEKLIWGGKLSKGAYIWTATSGSTGNPYFFPRTEELDARYSAIAEMFLRNSGLEDGSTLMILGFAMGIWSAGLMTYRAFEIAGKRLGQHISILTPGVNKPVIFSALKTLSPHFDQTVLVGYPPFVKDIVDEATIHNISLKKINLRIYLGGELFTEPFRQYIANATGIKNHYRDISNVYGSADLGGMAIETPASTFIREQALRDDHLFKDFFPSTEKTPMLAQYNPSYICFESVNGKILLTGDNTLPLIRYAIGDNGGTFSAADARRTLAKHDIEIKWIERRTGVKFIEWPFVYIYERNDFSTKSYGAIIYAENIREGLGHPSLSRYITGKFTMATKFNANHDEYFEINVEAKHFVKPTLAIKRLVCDRVIKALLKRNSEYRNNYHTMGQKVVPKIVFWKYEDALYFKPVGKQQWVIK